ncbi:hypothetical protein N4T77_12175 [Clostridium sp. CX1]|uniref:DUF7852 domain-containing protein n=1 Tax=Clostridium tanneri TaxID=3037988 RepID=A0ABU4JR08_9CLOT|nr:MULTISPECIES: hypothetical protein [unclassified Clostridium]MCT8977358.1 hypothetical protein [Clostridium sp. CX1]MDW8800591.1 hypothetical protein [Clostridium sp. A1-XYC3]
MSRDKCYTSNEDNNKCTETSCTTSSFSDNCDCHDQCCDAKVIKAETECQCPTSTLPPAVIPAGAFVGKIPVELAFISVDIPVMATIKLEEKAYEIKRIKKNAYVTQCHLLPTLTRIPGTNTITGTLFIEGFVRKNIEYATKECSSKSVTSGKIRHTTVKIPYKCTTSVTFTATPPFPLTGLRPPIFIPNTPPTEIGQYSERFNTCDPCQEATLGQDSCQQCFTSTEVFNEPVFCELVSATFNECDIHLNPTICCDPTEQTFQKIQEKMLLTLRIKILQKQQVRVTAL